MKEENKKWEEEFDKLLYKTANNINEGGLVAGIGTEPYKRGTSEIKRFTSQFRQDQKEEIIRKIDAKIDSIIKIVKIVGCNKGGVVMSEEELRFQLKNIITLIKE